VALSAAAVWVSGPLTTAVRVPATWVLNVLVRAIEVAVAATAVPTELGVVEAVWVKVAEAEVVALEVPVAVLLAVAVLVGVAVAVKVGDGVKVLVGGTNWVGVDGRVTVGPPGVTVGERVPVSVTVGNGDSVGPTTNWVGVSGRAVGVPGRAGWAAIKAKNPTQ